MIQIDDEVVLNEILEHVAEQRQRAKLVDDSFELGVVTDKKPSQILDLINRSKDVFKDIGLVKFEWYDDALRSNLRLAGEDLLFSISRVR